MIGNQFWVIRYFCTIPFNLLHYYLDAVTPLINLDRHSLLPFFHIYFIINFYIFYYNFNYREPIVFYLLLLYLYLLQLYLYFGWTFYLYFYLYLYLGYWQTYDFCYVCFCSSFFFWVGRLKSSGLVGVHIVEWEFDFTNLGCSFSFSFSFYRWSTATDWTLIFSEGTTRSASLWALALANAL